VAADMAHLAPSLAGMKQLQTLDVSYNKKDDLSPLAGNHELHVHLSKPSALDRVELQKMTKLQAEMPRIHFSD
jgi:Leucine-rich repeat (LRR) protein